MSGYDQELRLLWLTAINAIALAGAWRVARSLSGDPAQRVCDTLLGWWIVQYIAVGVTGMLGAMTPVAISVVGVALSVFAMFATWRTVPTAEPRAWAVRETHYFFLGAAFVCAFVLVIIYDARVLPAMADDPLTYHLPAAAKWLQDRRISLFETWYFNPANTYSPLAGSMFAAWLMAPTHTDVMARFVQAPAVLVIFSTVVVIARQLGANAIVSVLIGMTAALCRPIISQTILAKDDLFLCAFVLMAIAAAPQHGRLSAVRLGAAIGLTAATKFTSIYSIAIVLLMFQRHDWRRWLAAGSIAAAIVSPWLIRNVIATANPIYPITINVGRWTILKGLFTTTRSPLLATPAGVWRAFVPGYFGVGVPLMVGLLATWTAALAMSFRKLASDPLRRAVLLGPLLSVLLFVFTSPYAELRFEYAVIALLACGAAMIRRRNLQLASAVVLTAISLLTSFVSDWSIRIAAIAAAVTLIGWGVAYVFRGLRAKRDPALVYLVIVVPFSVILFTAVWVNWRAYVSSLPPSADIAWTQQRGDLGRAWEFVRNSLPSGEPIAYANTYLVYPLMGPNLNRSVVAVPAAVDGKKLSDLPPLPTAVNEANLLDEVITETIALHGPAPGADWPRRLRDAHINYLFVSKHLSAWSKPHPADGVYIDAARRAAAVSGVKTLFENDAAVVLQVGP